jgi:hypothetical protein
VARAAEKSSGGALTADFARMKMLVNWPGSSGLGRSVVTRIVIGSTATVFVMVRKLVV